MATPDLSLIDKAMKAGNHRLAHELLDLAYTDSATPATARPSLGSGGQRPPLAMIVGTAAIALLVLSPFLLSSPSDSSPSRSEVTQSE